MVWVILKNPCALLTLLLALPLFSLLVTGYRSALIVLDWTWFENVNPILGGDLFPTLLVAAAVWNEERD